MSDSRKIQHYRMGNGVLTVASYIEEFNIDSINKSYNDEQRYMVNFGFSFCSPEDRFIKKVGVEKASDANKQLSVVLENEDCIIAKYIEGKMFSAIRNIGAVPTWAVDHVDMAICNSIYASNAELCVNPETINVGHTIL